MYADQQVYPTVTPGHGTTSPMTMNGITMMQYTTIEFMKAMIANVDNTPMTYDEMAQAAKRAATAVLTAL